MITEWAKSWWIEHTQRKHTKRHIAGWNYAAGELLDGNKTPYQLRKEAEDGIYYNGHSRFYQGMLDACDTWEKRMGSAL